MRVFEVYAVEIGVGCGEVSSPTKFHAKRIVEIQLQPRLDPRFETQDLHSPPRRRRRSFRYMTGGYVDGKCDRKSRPPHPFRFLNSRTKEKRDHDFHKYSMQEVSSSTNIGWSMSASSEDEGNSMHMLLIS